jgi:hypothetical protein
VLLILEKSPSKTPQSISVSDRLWAKRGLPPVYDLVTTAVYLPCDSTALTLNGSTRCPISMRYLLVIDSSGSHVAEEKMRLVKARRFRVLSRSFRKGGEVAIIAFRGIAGRRCC